MSCREHISRVVKDSWTDPEIRNKRVEGLRNSDKVKLAGKANSERWKDPEYKARRSILISLGSRAAKARRNGWMLLEEVM